MQKEIENLFNNIASLKHFATKEVSGLMYVSAINGYAIPSIYTPKPLMDSWLELINMTKEDLLLISETINQIRFKLSNRRLFLREEYLINLSTSDIFNAKEEFIKSYDGHIETPTSRRNCLTACPIEAEFSSIIRNQLLQALFKEIPLLETFTAHHDCYLNIGQINTKPCPIKIMQLPVFFDSTAIQSWLLEINIKESDILLLEKAVLLFGYNDHIKKTYIRNFIQS